MKSFFIIFKRLRPKTEPLIIDLYFLISADIAQIFNPTGEQVISIGILTNKQTQKTKASF